MAQDMLDHARNGDKGADRIITMLAAIGALQAQRDLLTLLIGDPARPEHRQLQELSFEEAVRAEILARFCAFRGNSQDVRRLAGVLIHMAATTAHAADRLAFATEGAELLRSLADDGDGVASEFLPKVVADFPEVEAALRASDSALPVAVSSSPDQTLGDILAQVLVTQPPVRRPGIGRRIADQIGIWRFRVEWAFEDLWEAVKAGVSRALRRK